MKTKFIVIFAAFFVFLVPLASAETVNLIENTDFCEFRPDLMKDYCKTVYEICYNTSFKENNLTFKFKTSLNPDYKKSIRNMNTEIEIYPSKVNCQRIKIEGYKPLFEDVDNVLCYGDKCYYEWIWWNSSIQFRRNVTKPDNFLDPYLVGDQCLDINGTRTCIWGNSSTDQIYYNNATGNDVYCIDSVRNVPVECEINQGTFPNTGDAWFDPVNSCQNVLHMDTTLTSCNFGFSLLESGDPQRVEGFVGNATDYDNDDCGYRSSTFGSIEQSNRITVMAIARPLDIDGGFHMVWAFAGDGPNNYVSVFSDNQWHALLNTDLSTTDLDSGVNAVANTWYCLGLVFNGTRISFYIDGTEAIGLNDNGTLQDVGSPHFFSTGCRRRDDTVESNFFNGTVDEVMVFNHSLNFTEVSLWCNNTLSRTYSTLSAEEEDNEPPVLAFVPPTPLNDTVDVNYIFANISGNEDLGNCLLEFNGVNETMTRGDSVSFFRNETGLSNANYTYLAYCNDSFDNLGVSDPTWTVINFTAPAPFVETVFCLDEDNLFRQVVEVSEGEVINYEFIQTCQYGCSNWTLTTLGNPGCEEGGFTLALIFIVVIIVVVLIIRGAVK